MCALFPCIILSTYEAVTAGGDEGEGGWGGGVEDGYECKLLSKTGRLTISWLTWDVEARYLLEFYPEFICYIVWESSWTS